MGGLVLSDHLIFCNRFSSTTTDFETTSSATYALYKHFKNLNKLLTVLMSDVAYQCV